MFGYAFVSEGRCTVDRLISACLALVLLWGIATASAPAAQMYRGIVLDRDGTPISGALVVLEDAPACRTTTNRTGRFTLAACENAQRLIVSYAGHPLATALGVTAQSITIRPGDVARTIAQAPASPAPSPVASPSLREIGRARATGRKANLVGTASAASEGTIDQEQIETRPILRPGEVLEAIPGLVISQHSGEGKANQYYLRGFQLDHGTDLESTINGIPVNLPTHAHGQGYSDINYLMPELVSFVEFKKGPYDADQGDFSTAGSYNLTYRDTIPEIAEFSAGDYGYERFFTAGSPKLGAGNLLYALEIGHDNNSFDKPDEYQKFNGVLKYGIERENSTFATTLIAYNGPFNSTDQIPQRLVDEGVINRYGYVDPSDGGNTYRYALSSQYQLRDKHGTTSFDVYGVDSYLDLFSNFTYYLYDANDYYNETANPVTCNAAYTTCTPYGAGRHAADYSSYCPANNTAPANAAVHSVTPAPFSFSCGDQREQLDIRFYSGFNVQRTFVTPATTTTIGAGLRNDNISTVGLFLTNDRIRYAGGTLSDDHVVERNIDLFAQSEIHLSDKFRLMPGVRADRIDDDVLSVDPNNSGKAGEALVDPKFNAAYAFSKHQEAYADFGDSYHSNDARAVTGIDDPQTHTTFDSTGTPVATNSPMTRAFGEEVGYRFSVPKYTATVAFWQLHLANELIFDGDNGTTSIGGPSLRRGIELTNFYTPRSWLTLDADLATSTARFLSDPLHQGTGIPESLNNVDSLGATVDTAKYSASIRMRYFGPRQLDQAGLAYSSPSTIFNSQYTLKFAHRRRLTLELLNMFNAQADDVEYYYGSWLPQDAKNPAYANDPAINPALGAAVPAPGGAASGQSLAGGGVSDYHFHPTEKRSVRLTLATPL